MRIRPKRCSAPKTDLLEEALWSAIKTLEESARLAARERAEVIRRFLLSQPGEVPVEAPPEQSGTTQ